MSQIMKMSMAGLLLIIGLAFLGGCGSSTPNSEAVVNAEGQHAAGWLPAGHMIAASEDQAVCTECHGSDYLGGVAQVSCFKCHLGGAAAIHPLDWTQTQIWEKHASYAFYNGTSTCSNAACHGTTLTGVTDSGPSCSICHLGGAGSFHPIAWGLNATTLHGAYVDTNGTAACANAACHGTNLAGVANSGPACSSCHLNGSYSVHPLNWTNVTIDHAAYVNSNGATGCANAACHGTTLGGVTGSGPACSSCHVKGSPVTLTGCTSCHANPPSGTVYPDIAGAHATHNTLASVTSVCDTCHNAAGANTLNHYNGVVNMQLLSTYNAKSGSAVRNPDGTCSLVSCHGGQQTPVWLIGTINVNTQCTSCHLYGTAPATPEYNSFYSGKHGFHIKVEGISCTECHDTAKLTVDHFTTLDTPTVEGSASATILNSLGYSGGSCTPDCHDIRTW